MLSDDDSGGDTGVEIVNYGVQDPISRRMIDASIDAIFFEASSVQEFADEASRQAFRWLWLGRYLSDEPEHAFIALIGNQVAGYLVGSLFDPATRDEFRALTYFEAFSAVTSRYPAHLHVNVARGMRGGGIGARLVTHFERHAAKHGAAGVHVVTGAAMRNVRFYYRKGYHEVARTSRNGGEVVMLGKSL